MSHIKTADSVLACPVCRTGVLINQVEGFCLQCDYQFRKRDGYWDLLLPGKESEARAFTSAYNKLREHESWSKGNASFYRNLPYVDSPNSHSRIWKQRAKNWKTFKKKVLRMMEVRRKRELNILDLGTGNGWAANRMADRGHTVWAVDINVDPHEGLAAHRFYDNDFQSIRASFSQLPFQDRKFDLALFNGALHYADSLDEVLGEALRVLRSGGEIAIMDTPVYEEETTGEQMIVEKRQYLAEFSNNGVLTDGKLHYLTRERIADWTNCNYCSIRYFDPGLPLIERMRRIWRRFRGSRKEAAMPVIGIHRKWPVKNEVRPKKGWIRRVKGLKLLWLLFLRWYIKIIKRFFYNRPTNERVTGFKIQVAKDVFNPVQLRSGKFMAEVIQDRNELIPRHASILELGTGTGIGALAAARHGADVTATDINPKSVRCANANVQRNGLEGVIEIKEGNLFEPVNGQRFDRILFNPPYYRGAPEDQLDAAWRSEDMPARFAESVRDYLKPDGSILLILSDHGEPEEYLWQLHHEGFEIESIAHRDYINEILTFYKAN